MAFIKKVPFEEIDAKLSVKSSLGFDTFAVTVTPAEIADQLGWSLEEYYNELQKEADALKRFQDAWKTHYQIYETFRPKPQKTK